ncbi:MAG: hypothetical protein ACTSVY_01780 [Candidatus Helarchaeota archaeon]
MEEIDAMDMQSSNKKENKIQFTLDAHGNSSRKNSRNFIFKIRARQRTLNEYVKCQERNVKFKNRFDRKISLFSKMTLNPEKKLTLLEREHLNYILKELLKQKITPTMNFMELKESLIDLIVILIIPISSMFSVLSLFPIIINESKLPLTIEKGSLFALREKDSKKLPFL